MCYVSKRSHNIAEGGQFVKNNFHQSGLNSFSGSAIESGEKIK